MNEVRDQTINPNTHEKFVVTDNNEVCSVVPGQAPFPHAHAEGKKSFTSSAVIDSRGWYGAVVQDGREILLFESVDPHHQGVIWRCQDNQTISLIEWDDLNSDDFLLTMNDTRYRLSPGAVHEFPQEVHDNCGTSTHLLTHCMMAYEEKLERQLIPL